MAVGGTIIPCKDASFTIGADSLALENCTLKATRDLVDVSTNNSGGKVERVPCFSDCSIDFDAPWYALGFNLADGQSVTFTATIVPIDIVIAITFMVTESIELMFKAKDVWRLRVSFKGNKSSSFFLATSY